VTSLVLIPINGSRCKSKNTNQIEEKLIRIGDITKYVYNATET